MAIQFNGPVVLLDGQDFGVGVVQNNRGTLVYWRATDTPVVMPERTYALEHPARGLPDLDKFESDLRMVLNTPR